MFRTKKEFPGESGPRAEGAGDPAAVAPEAVPPTRAEADVARTPPRRPMPLPTRPIGGGVPLEASRRGSEPHVIPPRGDSLGGSKEKTLVVGRQVHLKGEIVACDRLIVEGRAELTVDQCRQVQIGDGGVFRGTFDVAEAEIAGDFEGEMTVRERLTVRASGKVRGRVRYRHLVVEAGGLIVGEIAEISEGSGAAAAAADTAGAPTNGAGPPSPAADLAKNEAAPPVERD